jgi:uncharacterized protein YabE (DUF348 family)
VALLLVTLVLLVLLLVLPVLVLGAVVRCSCAHSCSRSAYTQHPPHTHTHTQPRAVRDMGIEYRPMDDILPVADVISLHVPLLPSTHHLINKER